MEIVDLRKLFASPIKSLISRSKSRYIKALNCSESYSYMSLYLQLDDVENESAGTQLYFLIPFKLFDEGT